jgi:magnesium chelatase subunit I
MISNAERRSNLHGDKSYTLRISDLQAIIPAITGKIELVYEGEQEGVINVAKILVGKAVKRVFEKYFPLPDTNRKGKVSIQDVELEKILTWFADDNMVSIDQMGSDDKYIESVSQLDSVEAFVKKYFPAQEIENKINMAVATEFVLEALYQSSFLSKFESNERVTYKDLIGTIFNSLPEDDDRDIELSS